MNEKTLYLCHHGVIGMHWGVRRYQPYGHGGYDPEHTEGRYVGKKIKAGVSSGTVGGAKSAKYGLAKNEKNAITKNALKEKISGTSKNIGSKIKEQAKKTKDNLKEKKESLRSKIDKDKVKKVAAAVAITSAVALTVALAANSDPGKKVVRNVMSTAAGVADKVNTIDTGYVKEIHQAANKEYMHNISKYNETMQKRREMSDMLRKKGIASIKEKEKSGIYKVKETIDGIESEFHDWYDELTDDDKRALDSLDRIADKYAAKAQQSGRKVAEYSEQHLSKENTTRTGRLKQKLRENSEKLSKLQKDMRGKIIKGDEKEQYQREIDRLAEEGRAKLKAAQEKKLAEILASDISEDIKFVEEYLKRAA